MIALNFDENKPKIQTKELKMNKLDEILLASFYA